MIKGESGCRHRHTPRAPRCRSQCRLHKSSTLLQGTQTRRPPGRVSCAYHCSHRAEMAVSQRTHERPLEVATALFGSDPTEIPTSKAHPPCTLCASAITTLAPNNTGISGLKQLGKRNPLSSRYGPVRKAQCALSTQHVESYHPKFAPDNSARVRVTQPPVSIRQARWRRWHPTTHEPVRISQRTVQSTRMKPCASR